MVRAVANKVAASKTSKVANDASKKSVKKAALKKTAPKKNAKKKDSIVCVSPINIALVKYWGKIDCDLILPANSSFSITINKKDLRSRTTIELT